MKKTTMVELILKQERDSEFPKLYIATNGEVAKDPTILTNIILISYPGPDFRSSDGSDFREDAIKDKAPVNANAYLGKVRLVERAVMCGDSHSAIIYLHIDEEQAEKAPKPEVRRRVEYSGGYDGDAD